MTIEFRKDYLIKVMLLTASMVLYKNQNDIFEVAIRSFLEYRKGLLYIIDNSPQPIKSIYFSHSRIIYIHTGKNIGFASGHNYIFKNYIINSNFHLILNPDVSFEKHVLHYLVQFAFENESVGCLMPKVLYPDGKIQLLAKRLPTPLILILRRFFSNNSFYLKLNDKYELAEYDLSVPMVVPSLSGCFLLVDTQLFKKVNFFDERFLCIWKILI